MLVNCLQSLFLIEMNKNKNRTNATIIEIPVTVL